MAGLLPSGPARSGVGAVFVLAFSLGLAACATNPSPAPPPPTAPEVSAKASALPPPTPARAYSYPASARGDVAEDYHGTRVPDAYRWLEKADDPATVAWVDAQNRLTRSVLDRPDREGIRARLTELLDYPKIGIPKKKGNRYFFFKNTGLQNQSVYYVQDGWGGAPRVLIDPNTITADGTVALSNTSPSDDGRLLGYAISRSGSDRQEIAVRDVATGKDLPDKLVWVKFSGIAWTPDGEGFFYTRYPETGTVPAGDEHYFPKLHYHRLGEPQEKDAMLFEKPADKEVGVGGAVSHDGRWLIILPGKGASNKTEVWVLNLQVKGARPVAVFTGYEHAYSVAEVVDGRLYARTDRGAPLGRVIAVDLTRLPKDNRDAPFVEIVPQGADTIQGADVINRKLVVRRLRNASTALEVRNLAGKLEKEIALPGIGTVGAISGDVDDKEMFVAYSSFIEPPTNFRYDFTKGELVSFQKTDVKVDFSTYETEQVWYPSKDGTKVSMFLIHKKGLARDGNRPVYLYAYGGFNVNQTPGFSATRYVFLEKDGIVAIPNLQAERLRRLHRGRRVARLERIHEVRTPGNRRWLERRLARLRSDDAAPRALWCRRLPGAGGGHAPLPPLHRGALLDLRVRERRGRGGLPVPLQVLAVPQRARRRRLSGDNHHDRRHRRPRGSGSLEEAGGATPGSAGR